MTRNRQIFMRRSPKSGWITPRTLGENLLIIACVTAWDQTQCKIVPSIFNIRLESSSSDKNQFSSLSHQENPGMNDHTTIPKNQKMIWTRGGFEEHKGFPTQNRHQSIPGHNTCYTSWTRHVKSIYTRLDRSGKLTWLQTTEIRIWSTAYTKNQLDLPMAL